MDDEDVDETHEADVDPELHELKQNLDWLLNASSRVTELTGKVRDGVNHVRALDEADETPEADVQPVLQALKQNLEGLLDASRRVIELTGKARDGVDDVTALDARIGPPWVR